MESLRKNLIIKITLWWAIIADFFETVRMIFPEIFIRTTSANIEINNSFQFGLLYGSPVMFGWTIILFWVNKKPFERKEVLLFLIPVIIGYMIIEIIGINIKILAFNKTIPTFILQSGLLILTIISFYFLKNK